MPNIFVKIPEGTFSSEQIGGIAKGITAAAAAAESIPDDPRRQALTWVMIEEIKPGNVFAGGSRIVPNMIPVVVQFYPPAEVLDANRRRLAAERVHAAIVSALPEALRSRVLTSCMLLEVPDGRWGANGNIWTVANFAAAAGYEHLQHLVTV